MDLSRLTLRLVGLIGLGAMALGARGEVTLDKVNFLNLPDCYRLSNGTAEVVVTTNVGPRVIRYALSGGPNNFAELPADTVTTEWGDWKPLGGHRLWHAPEAKPRSYSPDNDPVAFVPVGTTGIKLTQKVEPRTGIRKEMQVELAATGTQVTVTHRLTNTGVWDVELAPWALTIVAGGGVTILSQEPFKSHDDYVLPARPMVLWHYTDLTDARWTVGKKYLCLKTDDKANYAQKIGIANKQGWAAYANAGRLFVKRFGYQEGAPYPDSGCNCETFTKGSFMEVESTGPLTKLAPGATVEYVERWYLFDRVDIGAGEAALDAAISPLIAQTEPAK